jgi:hypothetical protein
MGFDMNAEYASMLLSMPLAQLRILRKAYNTLRRAGIAPSDCVTILMEQYSLHLRRSA